MGRVLGVCAVAFAAVSFCLAPALVRAQEKCCECGTVAGDESTDVVCFNDPANNGREYRPAGPVDIEKCGDGGYNVGWMDAGEALAYSFEACRAGTYDLVLRTASGGDGGYIRAAVDGGKPSPDARVPGTGWTQRYTDTVMPGFALGKGRHRVVLEVVRGWFNLDYLLFVPAK